VHLLILDVDGTLVHTLEAEAVLYPRACAQALGIRDVPSDWDRYRCPSDRGIVRELVERHHGRAATPEDYARVERRFLALIREAYARDPALSRPVRGAIEAVLRLGGLPDLALAIATAGWPTTAGHKLRVAGFDVGDLRRASSRDAETKQDIMRVATRRAALRHGVDRFASVVCLGDSVGDARAAAALGYGFIGIDTSGFLAGTERRYADFSDLDALTDALGALRGGRPPGREEEGRWHDPSR